MNLTHWLANCRDGLRSYRVALKASGLFGRSVKLRKAGRSREALGVAREALALLGTPAVQRQHPAEGSGVVTLTIQVEQLAHELGEAGAGARDLADALRYLHDLPPTVKGEVAEMKREWLPYLEARLGETKGRS